jgi:hypothetical protein
MGVLLNYASNRNFLFQGLPLRDTLMSGAQEASDRLLGWDPNALLNAAETDVADDLLATATFDVPDIDRSEAHMDEPTEVIQQLQSLGGGAGKQVVTRQTLIVPISGPVAFFQQTASMFSPGDPIAAQIDPEYPPKLLLHCDGMDDPTQIRAHFQRELDRIQERLAWTQADVEAHNKAMQVDIPTRVAARRTKLLADRNVQASIGFPIKKRDATDTCSVPLTRRTIRPRRSATSASTNPFTPEPALAEADYEAALAVLFRARNALERSRRLISMMGEEEIRDLLLVMLNDHFEGGAAGEVFNFNGKTDILIREGDRHIFIAECKLYAPRNKQSVETVVADALDQLLTNYLTWRDTKTALALFVRDADLTTVIKKAVATIKQHANYKRDGQITNEERHDVVLHANGDPNREIHLAFLPFHVGGVHEQGRSNSADQ